MRFDEKTNNRHAFLTKASTKGIKVIFRPIVPKLYPDKINFTSFNTSDWEYYII